MSEFAALFLSIYTITTQEESDKDKVYFSKYFRIIVERMFSSDNIKNILNDIVNDCDELNFISSLKRSGIKKYWGDNFSYDFEKDAIFTKVEKEKAVRELKKYSEYVIAIVDKFVKCYIKIEQYINSNNDDLENNITDYIKYVYKSDD